MNAEIMETAYSLAWAEFKGSEEFARLMQLQRKDTLIPLQEIDGELYLENRIRTAFDAGWNKRACHEYYGDYSPGRAP